MTIDPYHTDLFITVGMICEMVERLSADDWSKLLDNQFLTEGNKSRIRAIIEFRKALETLK